MLGVLFVSLVRRALVEDPTLPFPESVAASEIHKAGQRGAEAAQYLFWSIGLGTLVQTLGEMQLYAVDKDFFVRIGEMGKSFVRLGPLGSTNVLQTGAISTRRRAHRQPRADGRRLRDRSGAGRAEFLRERAGVGRAGAAVDVFPGPAVADISAAGRRGDDGWAAHGRRGVALHRAADRGGRNDGGRGVHADPHGQEPDIQPGPRAQRSAPRRAADGIDGAYRALHGIEDGVRR